MPMSPRKVQAVLVSLPLLSLFALATPVGIARADSGCLPLQITPLQVASPQQVFAMQPGRLRPQLEALLRRHLGVEHVVWMAAQEHEWPAHYELTGASWEDILEALAASYQLQIQLHPNRTAVISYLTAAREDL